LVLSCGIGVQAVSNVVNKTVRPALNTMSLGGFQGLWPSEERCGQCGDCVLDLTGGICPITRCAKSLLNGPCGGSSNGKCEISKDIDCAWHLIIERLEALGELDRIKPIEMYKDWRPSQSGGPRKILREDLRL